jgi:hypothetical protein
LPDDPQQVEFGGGGLGRLGLGCLGHGAVRTGDVRTLLRLDRIV